MLAEDSTPTEGVGEMKLPGTHDSDTLPALFVSGSEEEARVLQNPPREERHPLLTSCVPRLHQPGHVSQKETAIFEATRWGLHQERHWIAITNHGTTFSVCACVPVYMLG